MAGWEDSFVSLEVDRFGEILQSLWKIWKVWKAKRESTGHPGTWEAPLSGLWVGFSINLAPVPTTRYLGRYYAIP